MSDSNRTALITGITGQDGSYLAELLLEKGYDVHGVVRHASTERFERIHHFRDRLTLHEADLLDQLSLVHAVERAEPDELYNLAAQSFVPTSWKQPLLTGEFTALGVARVLEALRHVDPTIRFYQASSSEMFGKVRETPQNEDTPFYPRSPYGVAKVYGHFITVNYRESYDLFAVSGILFNHESARRGLDFVTRKVSHAAAAIELGRQERLRIGNLEARRDWGFAGDYVEAMWRMLQRDEPEDYVVGTGTTHTVRRLCEVAFAAVGRELAWEGEGAEERGLDASTGETLVEVDEAFFRPAEVEALVADPAKARERLGWAPSVSFEELVRGMVGSDLERLREEQQ